MTSLQIDLADCLIAYRKAKAEAFYENTHFHSLAFAEYEKNLVPNLRRLVAALRDDDARWSRDASWIGGYAYAPKSLEADSEDSESGIYFRFLDPIEEWKRKFPMGGGTRANAQFRLVMTPTIDFQIVSALWIMKVGHKFDGALDSALSYGNRLRRQPMETDWEHPHVQPGGLNLDCVGLFAPYFSLYRRWRENGLNAMRSALEAGDRIVAITMDIQRFYHRVNPRFLLRNDYLAATGVSLNSDETTFTGRLLDAIETWYRTTPDYNEQPNGTLPVGLSASKVISNALLADLDREIVSALSPVYYGRYVDDFFIVIRTDADFISGQAVMESLAESVPSVFSYFNEETRGSGLRIKLSYASDSDLVLIGAKQKIFNLVGPHGLDLVSHIADQIRRQSSEHRLLPIIPETGEEMASRALLAQPSASLEVDALRKADVISVRRLGLALLLRDVEAYARDLPPHNWRDRRKEFYGLIERHVITPQGFFEFFSYIHRVFSLMVACGDHKEALALVRRVSVVAGVVADTTSAGSIERARFESCKAFYGRALLQAGLQAATVVKFKWTPDFWRSLTTIRELDSALVLPRNSEAARRIATDLLYADFGRRPYRELWLAGGKSMRTNPPVPSTLRMRRILRLGAVRAFRLVARLKVPYWPAIAFPTRPIGLSDLTIAAPSLLHSPVRLRGALFAFRGARAQRDDGFGMMPPERDGAAPQLLVGTKRKGNPRIAIPSLFTSDYDWIDAARGRPRLTRGRYERIHGLVNDMCRGKAKPTYVVFPECSVPRRWAVPIAYKLAQQRISFVAGLEYRTSAAGLHNEALVSLTTEWPWYPASMSYVQEKMAPAHDERRNLKKLGRLLYRPKIAVAPVYVHGGFCFGLLICSDLTTAEHRIRFQGAIDALFVIEWNQDIETFGFLVEATAHDIHGYVVQVNNRRFGDSRVRVPRKIDYERDVVRVKGGISDYFVIAELEVNSLRKFQRKPKHGPNAQFKPLPIGYRMSERRRKNLRGD